MLCLVSAVFGGLFKLAKPLDWNVAGADLVFVYCDAVVYFILTMLVEILKSKPWIYRKIFPGLNKKESSDVAEDIDVLNERKRVKDNASSTDLVVLENFRKVYRTSLTDCKVAVHDVSFGIPQGECFGLLGVNGAGKSTIFKFLTGEILPTSGNAYMDGKSILSNQREVRHLMGYCPQFDALLPLINVREHLQLFGRIKGITGDRLERVVEFLLNKLNLKDFEFTQSQDLSGGNKRKLSLGIAVIGSPPIILADEPSTGMDPLSRRFLWDIIVGDVPR